MTRTDHSCVNRLVEWALKASLLAASFPHPAHPPGDAAIAAFDAAGPCVGVELRALPVEAGDRHLAVGGDVLPAIGQCAGEISRARIVPDEGGRDWFTEREALAGHAY
jgi:hypothetical protein